MDGIRIPVETGRVFYSFTGLGELKTTLIQVIIVILAVNVLEHVIIVGPEALKWEILIIPAAILCLTALLRLMHIPRE